MATIKATFKLDNLKRLEKNVTKVNLSETLSREFAQTLQTVILQRATVNEPGGLASSVKSKKIGRYGSGVYAADYFWYANNGRNPGKAPPTGVAKLENWAKATGWDVDTLRGNIGKHGTKKSAGHFYEAAKQIFAYKKKRAYKKILKAK